MAVLILRNVGNRCRQLAAMASGNTLGPPGRAGRIEHQAGGEFVRRRRPGDRRRLPQRLDPPPVTLAVGRDDDAARIYLDRSRGLRGGVTRGAVEYDRRGLGVFQAVLDFIGTSTPTHGREDEADQVAGPVQRRHLVAIAHDDDEMLPGLESHLLQTARHRFDLAIPLRIAASAIAIDDRFLVRPAQDRDGKGGAEIHRQDAFSGRFEAASRMAATIAV